MYRFSCTSDAHLIHTNWKTQIQTSKLSEGTKTYCVIKASGVISCINTVNGSNITKASVVSCANKGKISFLFSYIHCYYESLWCVSMCCRLLFVFIAMENHWEMIFHTNKYMIFRHTSITVKRKWPYFLFNLIWSNINPYIICIICI